MKRDNLLIVADSERDADMLYAAGLFVPAPFIFMRLAGKDYILASDLELARVRRGARRGRVLSLNQYLRRLERDGVRRPGLPDVVRLVLREERIKKVLVPAAFPLGLARQLRRLKVKVKLKEDPFFPERQYKSAEEVKKISGALTMAEVGLAEGLHAVRNAKVARNGRLLQHHVPLTSERLRAIIETAILQAGGVATRTIVACGRQGCDPHEPGHGPLKVNQPIVIDVFPRSQKTGFFGDITRTVVKGRASEAVRRLYAAVERAQELAFASLESGTLGREVHQTVSDFFAREGYRTRRAKGQLEGFIHGTGHGLGLEIHELPRLNALSEDRLRPGHVVTVEPGLYYRGLGGVRLEDVALVTGNGARNLTKFEKVLEV